MLEYCRRACPGRFLTAACQSVSFLKLRRKQMFGLLLQGPRRTLACLQLLPVSKL